MYPSVSRDTFAELFSLASSARYNGNSAETVIEREQQRRLMTLGRNHRGGTAKEPGALFPRGQRFLESDFARERGARGFHL